MKINATATLKFNYMSDTYHIDVTLIGMCADVFTYDISLRQLRYILINEDAEWHFIADIQPCAKLKEIIIRTIGTTADKHTRIRKATVKPIGGYTT